MDLVSGTEPQENIVFFGTDGIRGKAETLFTAELLHKLGFFSDKVLPKKKPILIGQDSRLSSPKIVNGLADGLMASGREVWLLGLCPTAIEKIGEASNNISQILAVHEERLDTQERERMERRKESDAAVKEVHSRISTASREQQAAISSSEAKVLNEIKLLRTEVNKEQEHMEDRIRKLEQWRWILMGILIAGTALFPNIGRIVSMLGTG